MVKATLILKSSNIYTGKDNELLSGFVAIKDNRIIYVGNDHLFDYIDNDTIIYDLKDKLIMPGIHDSHLHFFLSALFKDKKVRVAYGEKSEEECVKGLKEIENLNTKDEWMISAGWYHPLWENGNLPTKYSLDKVYPDRPVCMISYDLHTLWLNSYGLNKLGIDCNYENVKGGVIDRDENNIPLGIFHEAASAKILQKILNFDDNYIYDFYSKFVYELNSFGITAVCDMSISPNPGMDFINENIYQKLIDNNKLNLRVHMYPSTSSGLTRPINMKNNFKGPYLYCDGVKQFFDGVSSCHTAWLHEPYTNAYYDGDVGSTIIEPEEMRKIVLDAYEHDLSIRVHTIGDKAISKMIDYLIEAKKLYGEKPYLQNCLEHLENLKYDDIERLAKNNIVLSVQPAHAVFDMEGVERDLGKDRIQLMWPFKTELEKGCILAFGTDSPVVDINPFEGIYNAVTRKHSITRKPKNGWIAKEKISRFDAVKAYTYGSACSCNYVNEYGSIEKNKYADLCVLDKNIFTIDEEDIPSIKCVLTIFDGKIVYQNDNNHI